MSCCTEEKSNQNQPSVISPKTVYLVLKSLGNPFFRDIQTGVEDACDSNIIIQVRSGEDESDIIGQTQILESIVNASVKDSISGVILSPSSSGGELLGYIKQLQNRNIPVILVDTRIDSSLLAQYNIKPLPFITSSNIDGGAQAAEFIVSQLQKGRTSILLLGGVESQETAIQRKEGFENYLKTVPIKYDVKYREARWSRIEAQTITASFYSAGMKFDAIFAANDEMALGALQATMNKNILPKPIIVGFDAIDEAKISIHKNGLNATIAQNPKEMGRKAIEILDSIWQNGDIEIANYIQTQVVK